MYLSAQNFSNKQKRKKREAKENRVEASEKQPFIFCATHTPHNMLDLFFLVDGLITFRRYDLLRWLANSVLTIIVVTNDKFIIVPSLLSQEKEREEVKQALLVEHPSPKPCLIG